MGRPWGFISAPLGSFGYPWGPCWCLVGTLGCGPGPLEPLLWKMLKKGYQNGRRKKDKFNDILSFCGKWQTAVGLRLCSRIRVRAPCFHSLGLPWCPWIFQCFFDVFWSPFGTPFHGFGGRACTQLFDFKNKALVYLYLDSLLPLRYGAFYMQPGGSSPRPAAGSTSPSASTRPRALLTCFLGLCGTLHGLVVSL